MEVRIIKTCHGLTELRFLDGVLLPAGAGMVEVCEVLKREAERILERETMKHIERWLAEPPALSLYWIDQQ